MGWLTERGRWTSEVPGVGIRARARLTQGSTQVQGSPMEITPLLLQDRDDPHNIRIQMLLELCLSLSFSKIADHSGRGWAALYRLAAQRTRLHTIRGTEAPISGFWSRRPFPAVPAGCTVPRTVYRRRHYSPIVPGCSHASRAACGMASSGKRVIPFTRRLGRACRTARTVAPVPRGWDGS